MRKLLKMRIKQFIMESFCECNKKGSFKSGAANFQESFAPSDQDLSRYARMHEIQTYQQKAPFLKYASSVLEFGAEEEEKNQHIQIYEESELFNPPKSLIQRYETMKKERLSYGNISCENLKQNNRLIRNIEKGLTQLAVFLQTHSQKNIFSNQNSSPSSLIDILAVSSVQNFTLVQDKDSFKQAFLKIKYFSYPTFEQHKTVKPSVPLDKKKNLLQCRPNHFHLKQIKTQKKQGAEQLVGSLTFKMLVLESQCFRIIKLFSLSIKTRKICFSIQKILVKRAFTFIKESIRKTSSRLDSKILTLSKSKSSLSKLKIHSSGSQRKWNKKFKEQQNGSMIEENGVNQRIVSSVILQHFDFKDLKSNYNKDEGKNGGKMGFNQETKKKSIKESNSQAETLNSKKSFQSQYQFGEGINSKVSTQKKPNSAKNLTPTYALYESDLEEIPTEKFIRKRNPQNQLEFERKLFLEEINPAKDVCMFSKQERRYLNVRTNLFELPIQMGVKQLKSKKTLNKESMSQIYHMLPDGLIKNQISQPQNQTLAPNLNILSVNRGSDSLGYDKEKLRNHEITQREQKKKKPKEAKDIGKIQKYYFDLGIAQNHQKIKSSQNISKDCRKALPNQQIQAHNIESPPSIYHQTIQNTNSSPKAENPMKEKEKRAVKIKTKKSDNFEEYYFKAQINKNNPQNTQQLGLETHKLTANQGIRPNNYNQYEAPQSPETSHKINLNKYNFADGRTSKLTLHGSSTRKIKSSSPSVKFSMQSPHRTGKLGSRPLQQTPSNSSVKQKITMSPQNKISMNPHHQVFMSPQSNNGIQFQQGAIRTLAICSDSKVKNVSQLPIELNSSEMSTPKNVHQIMSGNNPSIIIQNRSKSKLKVFSHIQRSLSPHQNTNIVIQQVLPSQNSERKQSFIGNLTPQKMNPLNRPQSNNVFVQSEHQFFTPTNSNLSNQSGFSNVHRVINYGPNVGFSNEMSNRPSSILSHHSSQSKQKMVVTGTSQQFFSPTQRQLHMMMGPPAMMVQAGSLSPRGVDYQKNIQMKGQSPQVHQQQMVLGDNMKRGLNVMVNNGEARFIQSPSPNKGGCKMINVVRPKSISNEKIFLTIRK